MPKNGTLLGGVRTKISPYHSPDQGFLTRTDSLGDTLWTRTYAQVSGDAARFNDLIPISGNRIAASALTRSTYWCCGTTGITYNAYYRYSSIFMILDSMGNVLKDTVYGTHYSGGGNISADRFGGYMQFGYIDTIADDTNSHVGNLKNFPYYIAHLDTNFRMDWQMRLSVDSFNGRRLPVQIKQLQDGNFIVFGDQETYGAPFDVGWAMKVTRTGDMLWQHSYLSDTNNSAYIRDMVEKTDGSLVYVGQTYNDTLPRWHNSGDLWLVGTDSNGCELPGCGNGLWPTAVNATVHPLGHLAIYPNPTTGHFTLDAPTAGDFMVYSLQGRLAARYRAAKGANEIDLPGVATGAYFGRFVGDDGSVGVARIMKE